MVQKIVKFDVALKSTERQWVQKVPEVYTNDLGSVSLQFKITDCTDTELAGSTAMVLLKMRDGSFFQGPSTDVTRTLNVFSYTLKENEGNHDGLAEIQLIVTLDSKEFATQKYNFKVISGLDSDVAREIMIYDWSTLTAEARAYIDQFTTNEILREAEFDNAQFDRNDAFNAAQTQRVIAFNSSEAARVSLFNSKETARAAGYDADHAQALLDQSNYAAQQTTLNAKANKVQEAWIIPTLLNGFTGDVRYRKTETGMLQIVGNLESPTALGSEVLDIFTLPISYIPVRFSNSGSGKFEIIEDAFYTFRTAKVVISRYTKTVIMYAGQNSTSWHFNIVTPLD